MKLTKINRSKSFEMVNGYGLKYWDKLGIEADLGENEDPKECYKELGQLIDETHKENNPEISFAIPEKSVQVDKIPDNPVDNMIKAITTCTEVATLKTFEKLAKSNEKFQIAYDSTMQYLLMKEKK